ncbi:MAG TPA: hypothetical protein VGJ22_03480, partial [Anaerolineales bacterium]
MAIDSFIIQRELDVEANQGPAAARAFFDSNARLWMAGMLALSDLLGLSVAILTAIMMRGQPQVILNPAYIQVFLLLAAVLIISFARRGLYPAVGLNYVDELQNIVSSISFAFFILIAVTFILKNTVVYSRLILLFTWGLSLILIPTGRFLVRRLLIRLRLWGEPVLIIGGPEQALPLADYFKLHR